MIRSLRLLLAACLVAAVAFAAQGQPAGAKKDDKKEEKKDPELEKLKEQRDRLLVENQLEVERLKKELAALSLQKEKLAAENQVLAEKNRRTVLEKEQERMRLAEEIDAIKLRIARLDYERVKAQTAMAKSQAELADRDNRERWDDQVNRPVEYRQEPFVGGVLFVTDRRISLNGPIIGGVADYVQKRIDWFNNKSTQYPIFIVIDSCPGGSVMEGYRILKAMDSSPAPVYVVVKSFAASMAAVITTLAKRSYAYPNAVILHHQMSMGVFGNMSDLRDEIKTAEEWERRLHKPVADKMGVDTKSFVKMMYQHNSRGDWEEFADNAVKLKWVDTIAREVREVGQTKRPTDEAPRMFRFFFMGKEQRDQAGRRFVELPVLDPFDFYFIYNPGRYYR